MKEITIQVSKGNFHFIWLVPLKVKPHVTLQSILNAWFIMEKQEPISELQSQI